MKGWSDAFACVLVTPGFKRPNAFTQRERRSVSMFMGTTSICCCIMTGMNSFDECPNSTPSKPACATPMTVMGYLFTVSLFPRIAGSPANRCFQ